MRCPYCAATTTRVVDSRGTEDGAAVRRRRACQGCGQRFSTYERAEQLALTVRKRDGRQEAFDRDKVLAGITKATANLDVDADTVQRALARVEGRLHAGGARRVDSATIGDEVLTALREVHPVAVVRFASVYKQFTSPDDFRRELERLDLPVDALTDHSRGAVPDPSATGNSPTSDA